MGNVLTWLAIPAVVLLGAASPEMHAAEQDSEARTGLAVYDQIFDTRVRDGFVYYRMLKAERRGLGRFVATLASAELPRDRRNRWLSG